MRQSPQVARALENARTRCCCASPSYSARAPTSSASPSYSVNPVPAREPDMMTTTPDVGASSPIESENPIARALDERIERAYCDAYMRRVVEAELDPANFTKAMRDRKRLTRPAFTNS